MKEDKYKTLESLRDARGFLNSIKGYETDVELDTLAAIVLLRTPELAKRGEEALGDKYKDFTMDLYNNIDFTFGSEIIVERTMEIEVLIRCAEADNKGMPSEEVYKKHIGIEGSEDSIDNLYFNKRLDNSQKQFVATNYDFAFGCDTFIFMAKKDLQNTYIKIRKSK